MTDGRSAANDQLARLGLPPQPRDVGYSPNSRYAGLGIDRLELPGQGHVVYLRRRWLPMGADLAEIERYVVEEGDRLDLIAARRLGDPEAWWRVADANDALIPAELEEPGDMLRITLPAGIPGAPDVR